MCNYTFLMIRLCYRYSSVRLLFRLNRARAVGAVYIFFCRKLQEGSLEKLKEGDSQAAIFRCMIFLYFVPAF